MRKILILMIAAILMCMASNAGAAPMRVYLSGSQSGNSFGHFDVYREGGTFLFKTFCVEQARTFSPGTLYYASFEPYALDGMNGQDDGMERDTLSAQSAWVYQTWLTGNSGWSDYQVGRTIWHYEGEPGVAPLITVSTDVDLLAAALASTQVMNLWDSWSADGGFTGDRQSQIAPAPVPEPATMLLLGTGLIGLAAIGRRKFKR